MLSRRKLLSLASTGLLGATATQIRAGCQTRCFGMPLKEKHRFLAALDDIAEAGYDGFETNFVNLQGYFEEPGEMLEAFRKRKLALIGLHGAPRLHRRDLLDAELAQGVRIASGIRALGGAYFVMSGSSLPRGPELKPWANLVARFGRLCKDHGVTLAYHNHASELENDGEILNGLLHETRPEDVALLLDVSYFAEAPSNLSGILSKYASRLAGVHLRTMRGKDEAKLEGAPDLATMAALLHRLRWSGWAIVELNVRQDLSSREMVAQCRKFMREKMKI